MTRGQILTQAEKYIKSNGADTFISLPLKNGRDLEAAANAFSARNATADGLDTRTLWYLKHDYECAPRA